MIIIADSSALIAVATCRALDILDALFNTVLVPVAVYEEVCSPGKPQAEVLKKYLDGKVQAVDMHQHHLKKITGLGKGELEAMALYQAVTADVILIDDRRAKKSAYANGLETIGSLGMLLLAKDQQLLTEITSRVRLLESSDAHLSPALIEQVLRRAGE